MIESNAQLPEPPEIEVIASPKPACGKGFCVVNADRLRLKIPKP